MPAAAERPALVTRRRPRVAGLQPKSIVAGHPWSRTGYTRLREPQLSVGFLQRLDHRVQIAVQHLIKVVGLEADSVIRDAVLGKVVGTDALRPVDCADLAPSGGRGSICRLFLSSCDQPSPQHAHSLLAVLQL